MQLAFGTHELAVDLAQCAKAVDMPSDVPDFERIIVPILPPLLAKDEVLVISPSVLWDLAEDDVSNYNFIEFYNWLVGAEVVGLYEGRYGCPAASECRFHSAAEHALDIFTAVPPVFNLLVVIRWIERRVEIVILELRGPRLRRREDPIFGMKRQA